MSSFFNGTFAHSGRGVVVIGAGVSGLTSALVLRRHGFAVTVVADAFAPRVTSVVAGALWEWPPAVCGRHENEGSIARAKAWCELSYATFADLARDRTPGVYLRPATFYFRQRVADDPRQRQKMEELAERVQGFRHDAALVGEFGVSRDLGLCDAYEHVAPMIDTDAYMRWLLDKVRDAGCCIREEKVKGPLSDRAATLAREHGARVVVNCAGLGARELGDRTLFPLRGALVRVRNDGKSMPRLTRAHCVANDGSGRFLFVVPRGDDTVVLGGLAEPHEWGLEVGMHNYAPIREMYRRSVEFLPVLASAQIDATESVRVGLRPFRADGVRLEIEPGTPPIVHNYGHGGSGVTFSWGCAAEVADQVENAFAS
jgi:D-amino-acid oxidase